MDPGRQGELVMGEVIRFPDEVNPRGGKYVDANTEPATVIILPVIRIERDPDGRQEPRERLGRLNYS